MRVKFQKGKQREFMKKVLFNSNCPSLYALKQFGFEVPYSTIKSYFSENRLMPKPLFLNLCEFSKLDPETFEITFLEEHWGQIKGGKK